MIRGRFAPSPSGRMHLGNIYSAVLSYLSAKNKDGEWIIRIEDLDRQRCKREYATQVIDDLHWLGLESDAPIIYQSERDDIYQKELDRLKEIGLTYECFCKRADIIAASRAPHESDGKVIYNGKCRTLTEEEKNLLRTTRTPSTRIIVPDKEVSFTDGHYGEQTCNLNNDCGDFIVQRADGNFAYQIAVVVDDALQGINEIVRGRDLLDSTHQQIFLYEKLNYPTPQFIHLPLLMSAETGHRLAKRDKCTDMGYLRDNYSPEELLGHIIYLAGIIDKDEAVKKADAIAMFKWDSISKKDIVVRY